MEKETTLDTRDAVLLHLEEIERNLSWLSEKTQIPYPTLYSVFKQKHFSLSDKNLEKINNVLATDFKNNN
jgi:predicted transcriptional regulator